MRRDCFLRAYAKVQALISKINDAQELFPISSGAITEWMRLIQEELNLLRGVMKSDRQRYKRFYKDENENSDIVDGAIKKE